MNREDAAREIDNTACCFSDKRFRDAMHMAAAALRGPQLDPDTGLMPCGCGGDAMLDSTGDPTYPSVVQCKRCYIATDETCDAEHAIATWNRAMGWREDE